MGIIRLYEICPEAEKAGVENAVVTGVTDNTAEVKQGSIFVCVKGARICSEPGLTISGEATFKFFSFTCRAREAARLKS